MLERDRILRAVDARCSPEELAFRHPQTILQDVWNIEERNAHAYHRSDRASGALTSYDELVAVDCDCISAATDPESIIIERESEAERKRILAIKIARKPAGCHCRHIFARSITSGYGSKHRCITGCHL